MNKTENIGYLWLGENIKTPDGRKTIFKIWWGICKKTKKVALASLIPVYPLLIQDTGINEEKECFDGEYCLNIDCPYAKSQKLIDAIKQTEFVRGNLSDEELITFFNNAFDFIESDYLKSLYDDNIKYIFEDEYGRASIIENAFEQKIK